uniref:Uncharacterized protein n=1 Tax=viral metagenome TaxID=1070528 RepID=A0A6M3IWU1_9ZZZZ
MLNPFKKREARNLAVKEARDKFTSWLEISLSAGWKTYEEKVEKKIEILRNKIENDTSLTGEDLKRLQLALQVWKEVKRIPKELEQDAKGGK